MLGVCASAGEEPRRVQYSGPELWELELAWATTVHKAQGSEARAVVLALAPSHRPLLTRRLLYTGARAPARGAYKPHEVWLMGACASRTRDAVIGCELRRRDRPRADQAHFAVGLLGGLGLVLLRGDRGGPRKQQAPVLALNAAGLRHRRQTQRPPACRRPPRQAALRSA